MYAPFIVAIHKLFMNQLTEMKRAIELKTLKQLNVIRLVFFIIIVLQVPKRRNCNIKEGFVIDIDDGRKMIFIKMVKENYAE